VLESKVINWFTNIGSSEGPRTFPGFPQRTPTTSFLIAPRGATRVELSPDDLIMIEVGQTEYALVAAYGMQGEPALDALSLTADTDCRLADFDNGPHSGWLEVHGVQIGDTLATTKIGGDEKPVILKAKARVSAWFIRPVTPVDLVGASGRGTIVVSHQRASANGPTLPQPLGDIRDEFTVERGTARSYELRKGEVVQIIDVDGQQCSDFQACRLQGLDLGAELFIDGNATRSLLRRAFPLPGLLDKFFDADLVPLLQVMQDTCGRHDTFGLACHARGYCSSNALCCSLESGSGVERRA
jgi:aminomethyltransferase